MSTIGTHTNLRSATRCALGAASVLFASFAFAACDGSGQATEASTGSGVGGTATGPGSSSTGGTGGGGASTGSGNTGAGGGGGGGGGAPPATFTTCPATLPSGWLFCDDFETGDLSTSWSAARWGGGSYVQVSTAIARTGTNALAFNFLGGVDGEDAWAEQRFELGGQYDELWFRYDLQIPTNYYHRTQVGGGNNKSFITLWADDYGAGPGLAAGFEVWPDGGGAGELTFHPFRPEIGHIPAPGAPAGIELSDRGTWIEIVGQVRAASVNNDDGIARLWKTPEGGERTLIFELTNVAMYQPNGNYLERGYLLGWSNSGFDEDTTLTIDNVVFSTEPLP